MRLLLVVAGRRTKQILLSADQNDDKEAKCDRKAATRRGRNQPRFDHGDRNPYYVVSRRGHSIRVTFSLQRCPDGEGDLSVKTNVKTAEERRRAQSASPADLTHEDTPPPSWWLAGWSCTYRPVPVGIPSTGVGIIPTAAVKVEILHWTSLHMLSFVRSTVTTVD